MLSNTPTHHWKTVETQLKNYNSPARPHKLAMLHAFLFHFFASQVAFLAQEDANMARGLEV